MNRFLSLFLVVTGIVLLLASCGKSGASDTNGGNEGAIQAVGSFSIVSDIVNEIGGDFVDVHNVVDVGNEPHEYEPKPEDTKKTEDADIFFYNGMNLEGGDSGWVSKLLESVGKEDDKVFEVTEGVEPKYLGEEEGNDGEINPHAFLDPNVGIQMAENIRDGLVKVDPDHEDEYNENADEYINELKDIDQEYQDKIDDIPEEDRVFFSSERAYQYMTERYGLKEGFIWEIDTEDIGTPDQIKSAVKFVEDNDPPSLFVESNVDKRHMETVSDETDVEISHTIYSDELGKEGEEGETYLGFLKSNIDDIYDGLNR
ncbi:MAG TPA: zinc ABC transporter substrate-binding protein [Virgibacillus sp.]|nr:zinc ABC transporter substrate-binding protein [Virgibacillus sp.]